MTANSSSSGGTTTCPPPTVRKATDGSSERIASTAPLTAPPVENSPADRPDRNLPSVPREASVFTQLSLALLAAALHALPWLFDGLFWCGWLGIALGLYVSTRTTWIATWWMTWLWSTLALSIAFHWSPAAMAYTLDSGYALGLAVAVPFLVWDGLRLAAGYWLAARLTRDMRIVWLPAALLAMILEWAMPSVFPWRLGLTQLSMPLLVQAVDIFGGSWTTLIAFAHAGLVIYALHEIYVRLYRTSQQAQLSPTAQASGLRTRPPTWHWRYALYCGALLVVNVLYGLGAMTKWGDRLTQARKVHFGLVQVDPSFTWSIDHLRQFTQDVAGEVDIVCWPESSGGNYELELDDLSDADEVFARSRTPERGLQPWTSPTCELLLGGKCYQGDPEDPQRLHVTAMLIDQQQTITARYHKRFLMPFGEYVPFEKTIPGMAELFDMTEHVQPGSGAQTIASNTGAQLGAMLCYEDMVPQAAYEMTRQGANVLLSLANGSAFESPYTLTQHRLLSQLRAIECRKFMLRCAATGETCSISPVGEIVARLPVQQEGVLVAQAALLPGQTLFTRAPWLGPAATLIALLAVAVQLRRRPG